ncbi:hypothetical protein [Kribbella sindirgiensis]|nr:hypothetical protein [Kribbella sindirgiensis]
MAFDPKDPANQAILKKVTGDQLAGKRLNSDADKRLKALDRGAHGRKK